MTHLKLKIPVPLHPHPWRHPHLSHLHQILCVWCHHGLSWVSRPCVVEDWLDGELGVRMMEKEGLQLV